MTQSIESMKETIAAQAAVIERLREALQYYANQSSYCNCDGCEQLRYEFGSETQHAIFALAIPTDSTQILAEVRRAEREKCAKVCDEQANEWDSDAVITFKNYAGHCAAAIRAME